MNEFKKSLANWIERASEEGLVITAILSFKLVMELRDQGSLTTDWLAFSALGSYLTLRLVRIFGLPK